MPAETTLPVTIPQFLATLREKRFSVSLAGNALAFKGDAALLSDTERQTLQARSGDILLYLKAHKATAMSWRTAAGEAPRAAQSQESWWRWIRESPVQLSHERIPVVRFYTDVTADAAEAALRQMVARHHVLCSQFRETDGVLSLHLHPPSAFVVETETVFSDLTGDAALAEARRRAEDFVGQALPVDGEWLIKAKIIAAAPDHLVVALLFAHMIVDGLSSQFLAAELDARLTGSQEARAALEAPPPQFLDYAASEHAWLQGSEGAALTDYWLNWMGRQSPLRAPGGVTLKWRHGVNVSHAFTIPRAARDAVQALGARHRTSGFFAFLTLYAMALARWSGQTHFAIRSVGNMRRTQALASLVGFMVCIDPIEVRAPVDADFAAVLKFLTTEYYNAAMLRLPGFLKFPAQAAHPGVERVKLTEAIAATFNFMPGRRQPGDGAPENSAAWPPQIERVTREVWAALLWPIYLRLVDVGEDTLGLFQFNETLVTPTEQDALMRHFFDLIREQGLYAPSS